MKLLLDEMLSPQIARLLRERGHDVLAIKEREEWVSLRDEQIIDIARTEHRAIATNNLRDYRPRAATAALPGEPGHYGMIFIPGPYRRTKGDIGRIVTALETKLATHRDERGLYNQETWLE